MPNAMSPMTASGRMSPLAALPSMRIKRRVRMIARSTPTTAIAMRLNSRTRLRWKITFGSIIRAFGQAPREREKDGIQRKERQPRKTAHRLPRGGHLRRAQALALRAGDRHRRQALHHGRAAPRRPRGKARHDAPVAEGPPDL